jgi:hypothetical protein
MKAADKKEAKASFDPPTATAFWGYPEAHPEDKIQSSLVEA